MTSDGSAVGKQSTLDPELEGLNPATSTRRERD